MVRGFLELLEERLEYFRLRDCGLRNSRSRYENERFRSTDMLAITFISSSRVLRILRILRAFRALRGASALEGLRSVAKTILESIPGMSGKQNSCLIPFQI